MTDAPPAARTRAPGPLTPYRVLDLAGAAGLYCAKLLGDLGADVIKLEPPGGDSSRTWGPFADDQPDPERSLFWWQFNTSKRGITLNLADREGQHLFRELARGADALVETALPGQMAGWGIGYEQLRVDNPGLVYAAISGFGQTGPHRDWQAPDLIAAAMGGWMCLTGHPGERPVLLPGQQSYHVASLDAAIGIAAALFHRRATGRGQYLDISLQEAVAAIIIEGGVMFPQIQNIVMKRVGPQHPIATPCLVLPCRDGYMLVAALETHQWITLREWMYEVTGDDIILTEPFQELNTFVRLQYRELINAVCADFAGRFDKATLYREAQQRRLPFAPASTADELACNEQLNARQYFVPIEMPELGRTVRYPGPPYRLSETPWAISRRAPHIGEHNAEILGGELGLSADELVKLREAGTI